MFVVSLGLLCLVNSDKVFERLPRDVVPEYYKLHITPSFDTFKFDGLVTISVDVKNSTNEISMNAYQIDIKRYSIF